MGSAEPRPPLAAAGEGAGVAPTAADVTALLVELGRLQKARQFYPDGHPQLRDLEGRGFRAFESEIRRSGPVELDLQKGAFRLRGEPVGRGRVDDLAQELVKRAVRRLRFDAAITPAALARFVSTLALDADQVERSGGFARTLYTEPCPGISVNELDYGAALAQAGTPRGPALEGEAAEGESGGPQVGVAGLPGGGEGGADGVAALLSGLGEANKPDATDPLQQLEEAPLDAVSHDDRAESLVALLRTLDTTLEPARYRELAREASVLGAALSDDGLADEGYRAILVLAGHAGDRARSEDVRGIALECLRELARGTRLDDLIDRSCAPGDGVGLRAAQILLRLGPAAVPTLLRGVESEQDLDRRGQLFGILIAMGDATTPDLCAAMQSGERRRAGVAVRLAGEMQNAGTVHELTTLLSHEDVDLRREAAKALVRVGTPEAVEALVAALDSPLEGMPGHAAFCLGVAGGHRALEALVGTVRRSHAERLDAAREAVRALGRMGRSEAVPELARILSRRSFFYRKPLRELQLATVAALARIPGDGARGALETAAARGPRVLREAARQALARGAAEPPSA